MSQSYYIKTYGCQMNAHESEKLAGILESRGYTPAPDMESADVIVMNTCCVRETAETHVLGNLGIVKKLKEKNPSVKVAVCGCMTQASGAAEKLKKRCPFIDIIFGTYNIHKFSEYLDVASSGKKLIEIWDKEREIVEGLPVKREGKIGALVNIMYGCNNFCSYCIVPYVRGRERSRRPDDILHDISELVGSGYKEITLLGQNVNSYSCDGVDFSRLIDLASDIEGDYWLKFMTSHPKDLKESVVKTIAHKKRLADFVHLPVQSGSDRVLSLMNRKYTKAEYLAKIDMIKSYLPDVGLSCDVMVGFPTETEEDFKETLDVVERVGYSNLFSFIYSPRPGTPAAKMDQVPLSIKKERIDRLIKRQFEIANSLAKAQVGKTVRVLCDGEENGKYSGKTASDKKVLFSADKSFVGEFTNVRITQAVNSKLYGIQIANGESQ